MQHQRTQDYVQGQRKGFRVPQKEVLLSGGVRGNMWGPGIGMLTFPMGPQVMPAHLGEQLAALLSTRAHRICDREPMYEDVKK